MPFQPVPKTWELRVLSHQGSGSEFQNIFHVTFTDGPAPVLTDGLAEAISDDFEGACAVLLDHQRNDYQWDTMVVTDLSAETAPQFSETLTGLVGTNAADPLPPNICGMVEWNTALRGRGFRGRTFISGFTEADNTGTPSADLVADLTEFGNSFIAAVAVVGSPNVDLAVVSRFSGKEDNPDVTSNRRFIPKPRTPAIATPIISAAGETVWKSQRQRAIAG